MITNSCFVRNEIHRIALRFRSSRGVLVEEGPFSSKSNEYQKDNRPVQRAPAVPV